MIYHGCRHAKKKVPRMSWRSIICLHDARTRTIGVDIAVSSKADNFCRCNTGQITFGGACESYKSIGFISSSLFSDIVGSWKMPSARPSDLNVARDWARTTVIGVSASSCVRHRKLISSMWLFLSLRRPQLSISHSLWRAAVVCKSNATISLRLGACFF